MVRTESGRHFTRTYLLTRHLGSQRGDSGVLPHLLQLFGSLPRLLEAASNFRIDTLRSQQLRAQLREPRRFEIEFFVTDE